MSAAAVVGPMPCFYPEGPPEGWCERHRRDHAMLRALRDAEEARETLRRAGPFARA